MKTTFLFRLISAGMFAVPAFSFAQTPTAVAPDEPLPVLAKQAVSEDEAVATKAIGRLRAAGPAGLEAMFAMHRDAIETHRAGTASIVPAKSGGTAWTRLHDALDGVGQQRDCYASQLYWFTDFDQAKAAARASGKPILSLRLLGKLNEEYSCANSRYFRTTLYANADVSRVLRDQFVLHWQSVRPVPRITIDFGDGRTLERTITGNSIHYILDSEGRPVDALPGLYGPGAFLRGLEHARDAANHIARLTGPPREAFLNEYHSAALRETRLQWERDRKQAGIVATPAVASADATPVKNPDAVIAAGRARGKYAVEGPLLQGMQVDASSPSSDSEWAAIAALHSSDARLDSGAYALIREKQPEAEKAAPLTMTKAFVETPMLRMMRNLQRSIAEDTVRNEYLFHARIHEWFTQSAASMPLDALNKKVYAELFLTPDSDPWLGLAPAKFSPRSIAPAFPKPSLPSFNEVLMIIKQILTGAVCVLALSQPVRATESGYVVHEWGTFTSVQGSDGVQLRWQAAQVSELPGFVYNWTKPGCNRPSMASGFFSKGGLTGQQRMETPVLYFYSDKEQTADVSVEFPQGTITEWYPQAHRIGPVLTTKATGVTEFGFSSSRILWSGVKIKPAASRADVAAMPHDRSGSHYFAARETDAALLGVKVPDSNSVENEKFLFYRGIGTFATPLRTTSISDGRVNLANTGRETLKHLFVLKVNNGHGEFTHLEKLDAGENQTILLDSSRIDLPLDKLSAKLGQAIADALKSEGLFAREAAAMVATWKDSWFTEEGVRVLYVLPSAWTDATLPMTLSPQPRERVRVMVGRAEIIAPSVESELRKSLTNALEGDAVARRETMAQLRRLGRFAEPALRLVCNHSTKADLWMFGYELLAEVNSPERFASAAQPSQFE